MKHAECKELNSYLSIFIEIIGDYRKLDYRLTRKLADTPLYRRQTTNRLGLQAYQGSIGRLIRRLKTITIGDYRLTRKLG